MLTLSLKDASLVPQAGAEAISGAALTELAKQYVMADGVIARLSRFMDESTLSAIVGGATVELETDELAKASASRLQAALEDPLLPNQVEVTPEYHQGSERYRLIVRRKHHGNVRVTVLDPDFTGGADYGVLARAAATFQGLVGKGAMVARGEGDKRKESMVADFREAMQWLRAEAERNVTKQRYKGLGEMNPSQLWETTMDPKVRRLLRVQIEDAIGADQIFTTLMGDHVEPRRAFIETHALQAANLDV
jgi:DNA gyrase subunit B